MIQRHFSVKQLKIVETFVRNYVKYANMEGFCRDGHILYEWCTPERSSNVLEQAATSITDDT